MSDETIMQYFENELKVEDDPRKKILLLADLRFSLLKAGGYKGCRFARIVSEISEEEEHIVLPVVRNFKQRYYELIQQLVMQLDNSEETNNNQLADTIYLLMEGASTQASIFKDNSVFDQTRKIIAAML
ncbi:hypothetical protein D3C85_632010 [compost metagenome]